MRYALFIIPVLFSGCETVRQSFDRPVPEKAEQTAEVSEAEVGQIQPVAAANPGWAGAKKTVAGLGDPNKQGRWLETPLVETEINGRVVVPKTGAQAYITLVPASAGGSRLSAEAMRALLVPFDELVELEVYSN
ncbi:MAG: hypothetical protein ACWA49_03605 [Ruegeria sp.]